jgi:cyanophycinase
MQVRTKNKRRRPPVLARREIAAGLIALVLIASSLRSPAVEPAERLRPDGIVGTVLLANVDSLPATVVEHFVKAAGDEEARLVIVVCREKPLADDEQSKLLAPWENAMPDSVEPLYIATREQADDADRAETLHKATGIWLSNFDASQLVSMARGTRFAAELRALLDRKGVLGVEGTACGALAAGAPLDEHKSDLAAGLNLLGQCVVDANFDRESGDKRLRDMIGKKPGCLGIGLPKDTALEIRGRAMRPLDGDSAYVVLPPGTNNWRQETVELRQRRPGDWNQLHRAARDRVDPDYLSREPAAPKVPHGALVIIGGGRTPPDALARFIELAGGADDGEFVVFPTAMPDPIAPGAESRFLRRAGVKHLTELPARELNEVDSAENLDLLKRATGVWFGGGRQWHFVDAYEGTRTAELLRDVLKRGGVIGGSSAGATIQGDYLVRGSPFGSEIMMCEGYERGLGFLSGVAIDQHFSARDRFADMTALMDKYPQFLGIGLDESTALVAEGHTAEIMGAGKVHFYDRRKMTDPDEPDYDTAVAGDKYDFHDRKIIPGEKKPAEKSVCP